MGNFLLQLYVLILHLLFIYHINIIIMKHNSSINKKGNSSGNVHRAAPKKGGMRSKSTIQRLQMYNKGKPIRNADGVVVGGPLLMNNQAGGKEITGQARIAPDRRWFGNTRTISQDELDKFRDDMSLKEADPYSVLLKEDSHGSLARCEENKEYEFIRN